MTILQKFYASRSQSKSKRSFRNVTALLLIFSLIFSWLPQAKAETAPVPVIHIGQVSGKPGDIIKVPISFDPKGTDFSFYASYLTFAYDPNVLEPVGKEEVVDRVAFQNFSGFQQFVETPETGKILVKMTTQKLIDTATSLYSLQFKIKDNAPNQKSAITLAPSTWFEEDEALDVTGEDGFVDIPGTPTPDPKPIGTAKIAIGSAQGKAGDKVEISLDASSVDRAIGSYGIRLKFDPAILQITNVKLSDPNILYNSNPKLGSLIVGWSDPEGGQAALPANVAATSLLKIEFAIDSKASAGSYPITFADTTSLDSFTVTNEEAVEMNKENVAGEVKVMADQVTPPTPTPTPGGSPPSPAPPSTPATSGRSETITVNVTNDRNTNAVVSATAITRTTGTDGRKKDEVNLTSEQAAKAIESLKQAGANIARILIPDDKDEVSELNVKLPVQSASLIAKEAMNLHIETANASLYLPASSLQGLDSDVFFHLIPIKETPERQAVETRIRENKALIQQSTGTEDFRLIGRPMTIETNLSSRPVTLTLPIKDTNLSAEQLNQLQVFIEHSDGTKELVKGTIVKFNGTDQPGIEFGVTQFSTFTLLLIDRPQAGYIQGYTDGTFKPNQAVTRTEMAALLTRTLLTRSSEPAATADYADMPTTAWASQAISEATQTGLMQGDDNGHFLPNRSMTRAEMAVLLKRVLAGTASDNTPDTSGVTLAKEGPAWAQEAIAYVTASGIMTASPEGSFRSTDAVTRAEAVTILNRLLKIEPNAAASPTWTDVPASHWAYGAIRAASRK